MTDKGEELEACLGVLRQELQYRSAWLQPEPGVAEPPPDFDEIETALWQVPELVDELIGELAGMYRLVDDLAAEQAQQRAKVTQVISGLIGPDGKPLR